MGFTPDVQYGKNPKQKWQQFEKDCYVELRFTFGFPSLQHLIQGKLSVWCVDFTYENVFIEVTTDKNWRNKLASTHMRFWDIRETHPYGLFYLLCESWPKELPTQEYRAFLGSAFYVLVGKGEIPKIGKPYSTPLPESMSLQRKHLNLPEVISSWEKPLKDVPMRGEISSCPRIVTGGRGKNKTYYDYERR